MHFKYGKDVLAKVLSQICNLLMTLRYVWYVLKVVKIVATFKKYLKRSSRSLPTIVSKIIQRIIHDHFRNFLHEKRFYTIINFLLDDPFFPFLSRKTLKRFYTIINFLQDSDDPFFRF